MAIGDIHSSERGSGARFNDGKPPVELLPLHVVAEALDHAGIARVIARLGDFQTGSGKASLLNALDELSSLMDTDMAGLLFETAHVLEYGIGKYAAFNWAKGMSWSVCLACAVRHLLKMHKHGVDAVDEDSGRLHAGHVACNIVFLMHYLDHYPEGDDRPAELRATK